VELILLLATSQAQERLEELFPNVGSLSCARARRDHYVEVCRVAGRHASVEACFTIWREVMHELLGRILDS
jgi:hypothetical protein